MPKAKPKHHHSAKHLSKSDPIMRALIRAHGPFTLAPDPMRAPFQVLVQAVANQQLNGKAAATILGRFVALFPGKRFPAPKNIASVTDDQMRGVGFSRAKVASIRDIAAKTIEGVVPSMRRIVKMEDDEIVERLIEVRGVGRWTVEMLLIFKLGRLDVLPADDFGVRNGFRVAYKLKEMPHKNVLLEHGERWRPFRSVASWYLWRAADLSKKK